MNLLIHDLSPAKWEEIKEEYKDWTVISDAGKIKPCTGCFNCWKKTPGKCIINDGYENMGYLVHHADEVKVISRYSYGGFSGFVKNVFDRCLGYVLPHFETVNGETHHQKRYDEDKPFTFVFYGHELTESEKESATRYVRAVCANFRSHVKEVIFEEDGDVITPVNRDVTVSEKMVLLNGSVRCAKGNSAILAEELNKKLGGCIPVLNLVPKMNDLSSLVRELNDAGKIVLCVPLYVDGLPSQVIRLFERFEREYKGGRKKIYVLANMGLYESRQLVNLFEAVKQWCGKMDFEYCGGIGVSAGELMGTLLNHIRTGFWPTGELEKALDKLSEAVNKGEVLPDIYVQPDSFPKWLYLEIANRNWNRLARISGIKPKELHRRL